MGRYSDPTANAAISNVMKEIRKKEREAAGHKREAATPQASRPAPLGKGSHGTWLE